MGDKRQRARSGLCSSKYGKRTYTGFEVSGTLEAAASGLIRAASASLAAACRAGMSTLLASLLFSSVPDSSEELSSRSVSSDMLLASDPAEPRDLPAHKTMSMMSRSGSGKASLKIWCSLQACLIACRIDDPRFGEAAMTQ